MVTVGSLFSGIGGIDLGLERAGMQVVWQVENDDYVQKVLQKHWPNVRRFRDVCDVGAHNLEPVDLIAGGFPCQDISGAGKGAGLAGERSGLWFEFARIIRELRPRYVLVENVPMLLHRGFGEVLGSLAACGYAAWWSVLSACAMGAAHTRERVFIVAYANSERGSGRPYRAPGGDVRRRHAIERQGTPSVWSGPAKPGVCGVAHGVPDRTHRLRGLGNAVVPQVAEYIGRRIVAYEEASHA